MQFESRKMYYISEDRITLIVEHPNYTCSTSKRDRRVVLPGWKYMFEYTAFLFPTQTLVDRILHILSRADKSRVAQIVYREAART